LKVAPMPDRRSEPIRMSPVKDMVDSVGGGRAENEPQPVLPQVS